jgi:undecaprenyl-diphosphatase
MVWLWQQEPIVLLALLLVVTGTWAFIELAEEVLEGETQPLDVWVVQGLRNPQDLALPLGPQWLAEVGRDVTALGSNTVLILLVAAVAGFLSLQGQQKTMWLVLLAVCSGAVLSHLLKLGFARPRPNFVPHAATMTQSFPSGHSMLSAVVYLSLGALLAQREQKRRIKVYFLGVALCLTFLVGMSRVYLGVHYPTDVLAGWTVGLVWAMVWWLIAWYMRR